MAGTGTAFRRVGRLAKGYDADEVDSFFARARASYESDRSSLTTEQVRLVAFTVTRHGYDITGVDEALDRLEDAVAARERDRLVSARGDRALLDHLTGLAQTLQRRLGKAPGKRFRRGRRLEHTYDPADVDALCDTLRAYFSDGVQMSVDDVRRAVFAGRRGRRGYREADVDAFLDRAVEIMLAVD